MHLQVYRRNRRKEPSSIFSLTRDEHGGSDEGVESDEGKAKVLSSVNEADDLTFQGFNTAHLIETPSSLGQEAILVQNGEGIGEEQKPF